VCSSRTGEKTKILAKNDVLRDIVEEVRLDADEYFDKINRQEYKDRVRINTDEVMARGGYGTPTIFVNGSMFFGNDRIVLVEEELRREKKG
jgi:2-hydroxychromene-2-carboxylate isomerase